MHLLIRVLGVTLAVAYPLCVYIGLTRWSARSVGLLVLVLLLPVTLGRVSQLDRQARVVVLSPPTCVGALALAAVWLDDARFILALPVLVSAVLLATFAATLRAPVSMVERYARLVQSRLTKAEVAHCRQVTAVWCGFFVFNGAVAGALALWQSTGWWAVYTGVISYGLMGALFVAEFALRRVRFRRYGAGLHDRLLARAFPPRPVADLEKT